MERLLATGLAGRALRVLIEVEDRDPAAAIARVAAVDDALDAAGVAAPRPHHGSPVGEPLRTTAALVTAALNVAEHG